MTLKTVQVTGVLYNPDGTPAKSAKGTARLTHYETDNGIVVPSVVDIATAEDGTFAIELWPNARGQAGSQYRIEARTGRTLLLNVLATVPDVEGPVALDDIINQAPYPPVDQAQQAVAQAQAAAVEAKGYRDAAHTDAEQTAQDRIATGQDRAQTGADRIAASESAGVATGAASAASQSASSAHDSATAAEQSATNAHNDAVLAGEHRQAAQDAAGIATARASEASDSAVSAAQSADDAAQYVVDTNDRMEFLENVLQVMRYGDGPYPAFEHYFIGPTPQGVSNG